MNTIFIFALVLAVAGGVIAHFGDRLGTYVGKKRISRFGLRPRHTAMLYTILSGSAISVLTLLIMVGFNSDFKQAAIDGPRLIIANDNYRYQIKKERANASEDHLRAQQATLELGYAQSQLKPVQQQLRGVQVLLNRSQQTLRRRQQQLALAQGALKEAQTSLGGTRQDLRLARLDFQQARQALAGEQASVQAAQRKVVQQQKRLSDLTVIGKRLKMTNADLQHTNDQLKAESRQLAKRTASSQQKLIFRSDQELGRLVVKAVQPVSLIKADLTSFLDNLGQTAQGLGATTGGWGRAVIVAVPVSPGSSEYGPLSLIDERKAIETLAQQIALQSRQIPSVVVVAHTVTNTFQGEQAYIRLQPYENALIYPKDAPIAATTISGAQTALQIVDALGVFLTNKVRPAVLHQRLIPQTDPETGQPVIGSALDEATSQSLVQQIEQLGGAAYVTAYAGEDTYSSGPLHLRFSVTPLAAPPVSRPADAAGRRS